MNVTTEICKAFNNHALQYEQEARVQLEIGNRLFERLDYLKIKPQYILDLGCGPGGFSQRLKKYYPSAKIMGLDVAYGMLLEAKNKQGWLHKWPLVNADMTSMPFPSGLFDLVFANQVIHWAQPIGTVISEINRVMNVNGCLMFSTLGPHSLYELREAWQSVDNYAHVNDFIDMHDIGDCLMAEYFLDPVVDMEMLTIHYDSIKHLLHSLKAQGVRNIHAKRNLGLTGKKKWRDFQNIFSTFRTSDGKFPLTYEVVYGHAWKGEKHRSSKGTETMIPVQQLRKKNTLL